MATSRIERERDFHNTAFSEGIRTPVHKYYAINRYDTERYEGLLRAASRDADVLEYGCGPGSTAYVMARDGARVTGIDISDVAIEQAARQAEDEGLADRCRFLVMNAEDMDLPDASFDVVCGRAILHHLDLDVAYREIARVLRPGGRAFFYEPLGHNPAINAYRRRTPQFRTEDEHPLLISDLDAAGNHFGQVEIDYFHLTDLVSVPLRNTRLFSPLLKVLHGLDQLLFRIPPLRKYAWMVVVSFSRPVQPAGQTAPSGA